MRKIEAVIFDWAGTIVDFGSMAPVIALKNTFDIFRVKTNDALIRKSMGKHKKDHIRDILSEPSIRTEWQDVYRRESTEEDVEAVYEKFQTELHNVLATETNMMDGVREVFKELRNRGIKIGSSTGYMKEMLDVVLVQIEDETLLPDVIVTASDVEKGRPAPDMIEKNLELMGIQNKDNVINVGDTKADIASGLHAGVYSVGVLIGSSQMGLSKEEYEFLHTKEKENRIQETKQAFEQAGADAIIPQMEDIISIIDHLERK